MAGATATARADRGGVDGAAVVDVAAVAAVVVRRVRPTATPARTSYERAAVAPAPRVETTRATVARSGSRRLPAATAEAASAVAGATAAAGDATAVDVAEGAADATRVGAESAASRAVRP